MLSYYTDYRSHCRCLVSGDDNLIENNCLKKYRLTNNINIAIKIWDISQNFVSYELIIGIDIVILFSVLSVILRTI